MKIRVYLRMCVCMCVCFTHSFAVNLHRIKAGALYVEGGVCNAVLGSSCRSAPPPPNSDSSPEIKRLQQCFKKITLQKHECMCICVCVTLMSCISCCVGVSMSALLSITVCTALAHRLASVCSLEYSLYECLRPNTLTFQWPRQKQIQVRV